MATVQDAINQALALHQAGQLGPAEQLYRKILELEPAQASVRQLLGVLRHQAGDTPDGVRQIRAALVCAPGEAVFHSNLSTLLIALAEPSAAVAASRSLLIAPGNLDGRINLATAWLHAGDNLAALAEFTELARAHPGHTALHDRLAGALEQENRYAEAATSRRRLVCLAPEQGNGYRTLANACAMRGLGGDARLALARRAMIEPTPAARFRAGHFQDRVPGSLEDIARGRARLDAFLDHAETEQVRIADPLREAGVTNFSLSYHDQTNRDVNRRIAEFYLRACPDLAWTAPHCRAPSSPGRRIRVAFVSVFLGAHTIGKLFSGILEHLPRDRFEVVAVSRAKTAEAAWRDQMALADAQVKLSPDLDQARRQIADIEADILVYLDIGMDPFTYYLAFARLAPVQAAFVGHPDTTGIPNLDYFITSRGAEPPDWRDHYTERAILLDEFPFFYRRLPDVGGLQGRDQLGLPEDAALYACPQTLFKMHPAYDHVFLDILRRDPEGRLVLIESAEEPETEVMRARLSAAGPDVADRVIFQRRMNGLEYLSFVGTADLLVETFAFAGGNSTFEALSTGTPILAYAGKHMRSRVTMDLFALIGLEDCVAPDTESFVEMALELAHDGARRRDVTARLSEEAPAIFERQTAVKSLAEFLERAADAARRGAWLEAGPV